MKIPVGDTALAYTYAWWLTGDEDAAAQAVRTAMARWVEGDSEDPPARVALLEAVRTVAIDRRTMCPASELALLHDASGVPLPDAARLADIDEADARVELAHGRLEALLETVRDPFTHPERLGGLAVGNPPDIAHARQCPNCATVADLLSRGREELRELPAIEPPPLLMNGAATRPPSTPAGTSAPEAEAKPASELDAEPEPVRIVVDQPRGLLRRVAVVAGLALALVAGTMLLNPPGATPPTAPPDTIQDGAPSQPGARGGDAPGNSTTGDATTGDGTTGEGGPGDDPQGDGPFTIERVALVREEGDPVPPDAILSQRDPVRIAVRYHGAATGVALTGQWLVNGEPFRDLRVVLTSLDSLHVFGGEPPAEGWTAGQHQVVLSVDGEVAASVAFRVA